jgi:nitroreductase
MDTMEAIHTRRSIRKFGRDPVGDDTLRALLAAAMAAPSAGNQQAWQFVAITDRAVLDAIPKVHPYAGMLKTAPLAILICGDLREESHAGYWVQDCAAATQNLLLAAHALGLGAVWLGVHPRPDREKGLRELLGLPAEVMPLSLVAIGKPAEKKGHEDRYREDRVHRDRW